MYIIIYNVYPVNGDGYGDVPTTSRSDRVILLFILDGKTTLL